MDWRLFLITFGSIFLAELGDKTQLLTVCYAAQSKSFFSVFLGAAGALVLITFLGCIVGNILQKLIPIRVISLIAGLVFIIIGVVIIIKNFR